MQQSVRLGASTTELLLGLGCRGRFLDLVNTQIEEFVVISDKIVEEAVRPKFLSDKTWLSVPAGEASKCLEQVSFLWSRMVNQGLTRSSGIIAVGGGVVCDLAGFAAATFLRGVPFFALPTSLLAMVDASVGGKVGIDLPEGKNLVGQFYPGRVVAVDSELLTTLPLAEWSSGMAEVIKHGILSGPELWKKITDYRLSDRNDLGKTDELVNHAVAVKVNVVKEDPYEKTGLRATLNLGHSFAHAIEWCTNFDVGHGQAVGLGLLAGLRLSKEMGILEQDFESELLDLLGEWKLPTQLGREEYEACSWTKMEMALARDKKNKNGQWCFVLPKALGSVETVFGPPKTAVQRAFSSLIPTEVTN